VSAIQLWSMLIVAIAGAVSGWLVAKRKGFSGSWSFCCFFLPFLCLVLEALPSRRAKPMADAAPCNSCGGIVSPRAKACPHCGQPQTAGMRSAVLSGGAELISTGIVAAATAAFIWTFVQSGGELDYAASGGRSFPACDSNIAKQSVESAIANAPLGKVDGLSIVNWANAEQISSDDDQEHCSATVTMSNAQTYSSTFRFYKIGGNTMVQFLLGQ